MTATVDVKGLITYQFLVQMTTNCHQKTKNNINHQRPLLPLKSQVFMLSQCIHFLPSRLTDWQTDVRSQRKLWIMNDAMNMCKVSWTWRTMNRIRLTGRRRSWFHRWGDAYLKERSVICNDEDTDGRARVTPDEERVLYIHCESKKLATFTVTLANVGRFLKFFQCRNQKEMAHNKNEKFPTVA